jgi:hypothetical protein
MFKKGWGQLLIYGALLAGGLWLIKNARDKKKEKKAAEAKAIQDANNAFVQSGIIY